MESKKKTTFSVGIALVLAVLAAAFYFFSASRVNYLIPGIPHYGIETLYFQQANNSVIASMLDILGYWGDERFNVRGVREKFQEFPSTVPLSLSMKNFFEQNGYQTYYWSSKESGKEIKEIKKFVNQKKKIPVIVFQKRWPTGITLAPRVVIGVFDKDKKVVVHDNTLGNNYEFSYADFEKMFVSENRAILAVWPSEEIKQSIKGPASGVAYPVRLEFMDKAGPLFTEKISDAYTLRWQLRDIEKSSLYYKEAVNDPNFQYFPRSLQVSLMSYYAQTLVDLKKYDEAIKFVNDQVMPLNQNLSSVAPTGWYIIPVDKSIHPYFILALSYLKTGNKDLAISAYKEMKKAEAVLIKAMNNDPELVLPPKIEELEKAISKK